MTVLCGGGTSSAQPGFGSSIALTASAVAALLNNIPTLWAVPLAGYIGVVTYNLATFCSTDPPAVPTFTAQDIIDLLNPFRPAEFLDAQDKFQQLVGAYFWHDVCQCDSVATPAPPTPPSAPTGAPTINPPQLPPQYTSGACLDVQPTESFDSLNIHTWSSGPGYVADLAAPFGAQQISSIWMYTDPDTSHILVPTYGAPANATHFRLVVHTNSGNASSANLRWFITPDPTSVAGNPITTPLPANGSTYDSGIVHLNNSGQQQFGLAWATNNASDHPNATIQVQFFCDGQTAEQPLQPCCPPDTTLEGILNNILGMVTLIQRQSAPFAYVAGADHSGLTGDGHISVQGLLGAKVVIDSMGTGVGSVAGDPDEIFEAGWITWGNVDGSTKREFITHSPFVSLPALAGQYTRLGYTLGQGVSVTITELEREP
jgi:hypothetical protein